MSLLHWICSNPFRYLLIIALPNVATQITPNRRRPESADGSASSQSAMLAAITVGSPSAVWKVADPYPQLVTLATGPVVWRKPAASSEAGDTYISYITGWAFEKTTVPIVWALN